MSVLTTLPLPTMVFLCLLVGLAGFVDAAAGGGGLIALPAYMATGIPMHYVYGCNKLSSAIGTTFSTARFFKNGALELKEATLYTAFRRLEAGGYIRSYWGDEQSGARRRYYAITPEGREKLARDTAAWQETRQVLDRLVGGESS